MSERIKMCNTCFLFILFKRVEKSAGIQQAVDVEYVYSVVSSELKQQKKVNAILLRILWVVSRASYVTQLSCEKKKREKHILSFDSSIYSPVLNFSIGEFHPPEKL